jgi:hypothetical protein
MGVDRNTEGINRSMAVLVHHHRALKNMRSQTDFDTRVGYYKIAMFIIVVVYEAYKLSLETKLKE